MVFAVVPARVETRPAEHLTSRLSPDHVVVFSKTIQLRLRYGCACLSELLQPSWGSSTTFYFTCPDQQVES